MVSSLQRRYLQVRNFLLGKERGERGGREKGGREGAGFQRLFAFTRDYCIYHTYVACAAYKKKRKGRKSGKGLWKTKGNGGGSILEKKKRSRSVLEQEGEGRGRRK